jgi:pyrimidine operon attenuation protein/uracil phosphoribosyltransferase
MPKDKVILNQKDIKNILETLAGKIISQLSNEIRTNPMAIIGIHRLGVPLAQRLKAIIEKRVKEKILFGTLDITLYRDDLNTVGPSPIVKDTDISFDITGKNIILVDDVLYTGRTIRSALNELADFGRPKRIQLTVLIDRGERELPIQADYVGRLCKIKQDEIIDVKLKESDGVDEVVIRKKRNRI